MAKSVPPTPATPPPAPIDDATLQQHILSTIASLAPVAPAVEPDPLGHADLASVGDVMVWDLEKGQRVPFSEWRSRQIAAEQTRRTAVREARQALVTPEPPSAEPAPWTRQAPAAPSAVDRHFAKFGSGGADRVVTRAAQILEEARNDRSSPLYRALHEPADPGHDEAFELYAAACRDVYGGVEPDSGLWDTENAQTRQAEVAEAHQRADAERASRRDFPPDHKMPEVPRPEELGGPVKLQEPVYFALHDYAAGKGISQEVTDAMISAFLSGVAANEPGATYAELERLWGPADQPRYKASFAGAQREAAALVARFPASSRKDVEAALKNPSSRLWGLLATLAESPAQRGRGASHGHILHAGA